MLTFLLLLAFGIVLGVLPTPIADWLQNFASNIVSGTLAALLIALVWTLLYFRLRDAKSAAAEPAPPTAPGT